MSKIKTREKVKDIKVFDRAAFEESAFDMGMANPDPSTRTFWEQMMRKGIKPAPDEFIVYIDERNQHP